MMGFGGGGSGSATDVNLSGYVILWDDFINTGANAGFAASVSGAGSGTKAVASASTVGNPGVFGLLSGTATTGSAYIYNTTQDEVFPITGGGVTEYETIVNVSALSDTTNAYTVLFGWRSAAFNGGITPTSTVGFRYSHDLNNGNWSFECRAADTSTSVDSGVIPVANTFVRLGFIMNAAGDSVQFYVNGVATGAPITTNIPAATVKGQLAWLILKSAGTTSRTLHIDAYRFKKALTTTR